MKVRIDIDTKTFVRFWLVVIGFALAGFLLYSAATAFIIVATSLFLALALSPSVNKLASIMPGKSRVGGTAISYIVILAVLGGFIFLVVPPVIEQSARFAQNIPSAVESVTEQWQGLDELIDEYGVRNQVDSALASVEENASSWAANLGTTVISGVGSLLLFLTAALITLVMTFFMLVEGPAWARRIWAVYTDQYRMERHRAVATRMYNVVSGYVNGQLLIALIASVCASIVVFLLSLIFDLPGNLAMPVAAIVFIGSLVPMFGATVAGILVAILLAFNDITAAIIFTVYFIVYVQIENNLITTVIQAKTLDLSPLIVLVAVTIGTYLLGIAGGIISIPIAGCIKVLIEDYLKHAKEKREQSDKPMAKFVKKIKEATGE